MDKIKKIMPQSFKKLLIKKRYYYHRLLKKLSRNRDLRPPQKTIAQQGMHCFFGYYDISPFSHDDRYLLGMQTSTPLISPGKGDNLDIGYYDLILDDPTFNKIGVTETWCWQQGCRLRWFSTHPELVIYNTLVNGHYGSVVKDIYTGNTIQEYPFSLYDLTKDGRFGITLNFSRLHRLRPGYGYSVLTDETETEQCPEGDGVWLADLQSKKKRLLFSLDDLVKIEPHDTMQDADHYINHLSFNPPGTSFIFFHLWHNTNSKQRYGRLFAADTDGKNLTLINNTGHVSHYTWLNESHIVITTRGVTNQLRYCLYDKRNGFEQIIGDDVLVEDGHPSFIHNGKFMITDTYPNLARDQLLLLYHMNRNTRTVIDRFHVPAEYKGEARCDLHPRPSSTGRYVCVDRVKHGLRAISILDLQDIIKQEATPSIF